MIRSLLAAAASAVASMECPEHGLPAWARIAALLAPFEPDAARAALDDATRAARSLGPGLAQCRALTAAAVARAEVSLGEEAIERAASIDDLSTRCLALAESATGVAHLDPALAAATLERATAWIDAADDGKRDDRLRALALGQAFLDPDRSLELAARIATPWKRRLAIVEIAARLVETGRVAPEWLDAAVGLVAALPEADRAGTIGDLALAVSTLDRPRAWRLLESIDAIGDPSLAMHGPSILAGVDPARSVDWARTVADPHDRQHALTWTAEVLGGSDPVLASALFDEAEALADRIESGRAGGCFARSHALADLGRALGAVDAGRAHDLLARALEVALAEGDPTFRDDAVCTVASCAASLDPSWALDVAGRAVDAEFRLEALEAVAGALASDADRSESSVRNRTLRAL